MFAHMNEALVDELGLEELSAHSAPRQAAMVADMLLLSAAERLVRESREGASGYRASPLWTLSS